MMCKPQHVKTMSDSAFKLAVGIMEQGMF